MDNPLEQAEQPVNREVKRLDQVFHPFDSSEVNLEHTRHDVYGTIILLDLGITGFPLIPVSLRTVEGNSNLRYTITPFNPSAGYQITEEDLKAETRFAKQKQPQFADGIYQDQSLAPLWFYNKIHKWDLAKIGLAEEYPTLVYRIKSEYLPLINRLRMQVFIPGSPSDVDPDDPNFHPSASLEARPDPLFINNGEIDFRIFYPLETGPLPHSKYEPRKAQAIREGFNIHLPEDIDKLRQVEVKFILLPEEEQKSEPEPSHPKKSVHDIWN